MSLHSDGRNTPAIGRGAPVRPAVALFGEALIDAFASARVVGGAPFNVACALGRFDCAALLITALGTDPDAELVKTQLARFGLSSDGVQISPVLPTGHVTVEQDGDAHRFTILPDQAYDAIAFAPALTAVRQTPPQILYFGTLAQRGEISRQTLRQLLSATTARRFLDLNLRGDQVDRMTVMDAAAQADVLKINHDELQVLADWAFGAGLAPPTDPEQLIGRLIEAFSLSEMIVTNGALGWRHASCDGSVIYGAATRVTQVVDTVGAGDAFSAIYLVGQLHHWPLALTLQRAGEFAAAVCGLRGAVASDLRFYADWHAHWFGINPAGIPTLAVSTGATP